MSTDLRSTNHLFQLDLKYYIRKKSKKICLLANKDEIKKEINQNYFMSLEKNNKRNQLKLFYVIREK